MSEQVPDPERVWLDRENGYYMIHPAPDCVPAWPEYIAATQLAAAVAEARRDELKKSAQWVESQKAFWMERLQGVRTNNDEHFYNGKIVAAEFIAAKLFEAARTEDTQ